MQRMYVITASEGMYLTQKEDVSDQERSYVTEISTASSTEYKRWRDADEEEYLAWQTRMDAIQEMAENEGEEFDVFPEEV